MVVVAERLTRIQRSRGLSIGQLARRSKIDEFELATIFRGARDLQIQTVFRLAAALDCEPATLLQGIEWIPDQVGGGRFEIEEPRGCQPPD